MSTQPTTPQPTGGLNGMMSGITAANLILIAVAMVIVVVAILYGVRQRRIRRDARLQEEERMADFDAAPPPPSPEPTPSIAGTGTPPPAPPAANPEPAEAIGDPNTHTPAPAAPPLAGSDLQIPATDAFEANPAAMAADAAPPVDAPEPPADSAGPLTQLKGLGPKAATRLNELGITRLAQLASLDEDAAERLDAQLGPFRGRLTRDRWVEQARFLAAGDRAGFEAVFGKL
jgi:predicted flap endonuclease-1-like 5' DNA nuclease